MYSTKGSDTMNKNAISADVRRLTYGYLKSWKVFRRKAITDLICEHLITFLFLLVSSTGTVG